MTPSSSPRRPRPSARRLPVALAAVTATVLALAVPTFAGAASGEVDLRSVVAGVTGSGSNPQNQGPDKALDDNPTTVFLARNGSSVQNPTWVQYDLSQPQPLSSYTLTTGEDVPERDPRDITVQGSNDGTTWITLDSRTGLDLGGRSQKTAFPLPSTSAAFAHYRLNVTANHGASDTQLADWVLFRPAAPQAANTFRTSFEAGETAPSPAAVGTPVNVSGDSFSPGSVLSKLSAVSASGENPPNEVAARLADGNSGTKWLVFQTKAWAQYQLSSPASIRTYTLTSGGDEPNRDPKDFRLLGSTDGQNWDTVDTRTGVTFSGRQTTNTYTLGAATSAYSFFRLDITANNGSRNIIQLADWDLIDPSAAPTASPLALTISTGPTDSDTAKTGVGFTGLAALRYSGRHLADGAASATSTLFSGVNVAVAAGTQLNYKVFPVLDGGQSYAATFVAVDLAFTDGTTLDGTDATNVYGYGAAARAQGSSNSLWPNQWNSVTIDLTRFAGKTVDSIRFVYDNPADADARVEKPVAGTTVSGWLDDISIAPAPVRDTSDGLVSYVDTRRGTNSTGGFSRGNNLPAAAWPNGFNFITPMTNADNVGTLYHYQRSNDGLNRPTLNGIGFSHEPSIWMGDRNQLAVMPAANDNPSSDLNARRLTFSHDNEIARPDLYKVAFDNGVTTEVTPTDHGAVYRFTFSGNASSVLVDQLVNSSKLSINGTSVTGWVDGGSGYPGRTRMFVYGQFSRGPSAFGPTTVGNRNGSARYAAFDTSSDKTVELRIASSFISQDQAQRNYGLELDGVSFDRAHAAVTAAWNDRLSVVTDVQGASDPQLQTLYSSLYRLNLYPNSQFENTGTAQAPVYRYASPTLSTQGSATDTTTNAQVKDGRLYVNNGFWDTYRTAWPLYSLLYPGQTEELVNGFVEQYRNGGWIARWSSPGYADLMTGTSSDVSFAEAYATGAIDTPLALEAFDAAVKNATVLPDSNAVGRKGLDTSIFLGFTPESTHESASWGLEGFINDYGIATMAGKLAVDPNTPEARRADLREQQAYFSARSEHFIEMFNPSAGTFTARNADGSWPAGADFDKKAWGGAFTEASAWTFGYHAPHDVAGLASLYGGRDGLVDNLHQFLAEREKADHSGIHEAREARDVRLGMLGFSNQVAHHIPYVLAEAGDPTGAQELIRDIENRMFVGSDIGQGYPGDEDNGEMSAWFVFSSLGFYPLEVGSGDYTIGTPLFDRATVKLGGKTLTISAPGASSGKTYVAGASLNGTAIDATTFDGSALRAGGELDFTMSATPSTWGAKNLGASLETPTPLVDATKPGYGTTAAADGTPVGALTDDNMRSSVTFPGGAADLTWTSTSGPVAVGSYTLTSLSIANQPVSWTLSGSTDGTTWSTLDTRTDQSFAWGNQTRPFAASATGSFTRYRLQIQSAAGSPLSLDEIELFATAAGATSLSVTPRADQKTAVNTSFTAALATITGEEASASGYQASVDYGDGSPSTTATLEGNGLGGFVVSAPHTFTSPGVYTVTVTVQDAKGTTASAQLRIEATLDLSLTGALNSRCIGDVGGPAANCDDQGSGYDRAKLATAGFVQGKTLTVPNSTLTYELPVVAPGAPDNVTGEGQTFRVDLGAGATQISVIGSATESSRQLAATLTFSDGSTQALTIGFGDWVGTANSPAYGDSVVALTNGRLAGIGTEPGNKPAAIFATAPVALDKDAAGVAKTVVSLTLPQEAGTLRTNGRAHIFALASDGDRSKSVPLSLAQSPVAAQTVGVAFQAELAKVAGGVSAAPKAVVNWGDGSSVDSVDAASGVITGGHTYQAEGTYTVYVTATDGVRSTTTTTTIVVAPKPVYTPTLSAPSGTVRPGATVAITGAGFAPGETVDVALGSAAAVSVAAGQDGSLSVNLAVPADAVDGVYPITAVGATSKAEAGASIVVAAAPVAQATMTTLSAGADAVVGAPLTLTATVSPGAAAGQVSFRDGETVVGSASVSGGVAEVEIVPAAAGERTYIAVFTPDDDTLFTGSQSAPLTVTVAAAPTQGNPQLTLSATSVVQGGALTATVVGLQPGERVRFELHSDPIVLGSAIADQQGVLRASLTIPMSAPAGAHTLVAIPANSPQASAALSVTAADSGNNAGTGILGRTGGTLPYVLIWVAALLVIAGTVTVLVVSSRRRRRRLQEGDETDTDLEATQHGEA